MKLSFSTLPIPGDCQEWNVTLHFYDEKQPNNLGHVIDVICPTVEKHIFAIPTGVNQMMIRFVSTTWLNVP